MGAMSVDVFRSLSELLMFGLELPVLGPQLFVLPREFFFSHDAPCRRRPLAALDSTRLRTILPSIQKDAIGRAWSNGRSRTYASATMTIEICYPRTDLVSRRRHCPT
jgi:hypothetical protein